MGVRYQVRYSCRDDLLNEQHVRRNSEHKSKERGSDWVEKDHLPYDV